MVCIAASYRWCAGAVRRAELLSVAHEFFVVTLRKPKISIVLKGAALGAAIVAIGAGFSLYPPAGYAKNSVQTATEQLLSDNATATPAPVEQQIALAPPPPKSEPVLSTPPGFA